MTLQTKNPIPESSIKTMSAMIGKLPPGDVPKAWWSSMDAKVLAGYDKYKSDLTTWQSRYKNLLAQLGLPSDTLYVAHRSDTFAGFVPPKGVDCPRWMRVDKNNLMIPRKRTVAEKDSPASIAFDELVDIPVVHNYMLLSHDREGEAKVKACIPPVLTTGIRSEMTVVQHPVHIRQPGKAVLAFVAVAPENATEPFEVGPQWTRMKLSTYHLLRERQEVGR